MMFGFMRVKTHEKILKEATKNWDTEIQIASQVLEQAEQENKDLAIENQKLQIKIERLLKQSAEIDAALAEALKNDTKDPKTKKYTKKDGTFKPKKKK